MFAQISKTVKYRKSYKIPEVAEDVHSVWVVTNSQISITQPVTATRDEHVRKHNRFARSRAEIARHEIIQPKSCTENNRKRFFTALTSVC